MASGYYLDGDTTLAEKQGSTWTDSYVWGVGQSRHNGEFVMHDALGSQCQLTNASDTITASDTMTAFGVGTNWSWTVTPTNKYWYKGLPTYREDGDGPQGGYFYTKVGARYYDSQFGRFITRDTDLKQKPYVYCDDDPVNAIDPTGHKGKSVQHIAFMIAFGCLGAIVGSGLGPIGTVAGLIGGVALGDMGYESGRGKPFADN